jgi:hypothetical protein
MSGMRLLAEVLNIGDLDAFETEGFYVKAAPG